MPPVVVAFPDCFTRIGGNQYINSAATGPWEDFLIAEMLPSVERRSRLWRLRATRCVRQELRRLRGDHARATPLRYLVGCGMPLGRYGL